MTNGPIDNSHLQAKLDLRRYFLETYHQEQEIRVLDCCQGSGVIWSILRQEFELAAYWGVDVKQKEGRLKIDSRHLMRAASTRTVVDIDTYGSPWVHWLEMIPYIAQPTTVFLTIGTMKNNNVTNQSKAVISAMGLGQLYSHIPRTLLAKVGGLAVTRLLTVGCDDGIMPIQVVEAIGGNTARYLGIRLEPLKSEQLASEASCSKQANPR